jgi:flagellar basal-body rod modification protein FlgD
MAIDTAPLIKAPQYTAATANPKGLLGKDAFMKLLVAELKQQDPMDPMKAREMVGQLADLSTVEKLTGIDDKLTTLQNISAASSGISNAGLIGRRVEADTKNLTLGASGGASGGVYNLNDNAETVTVKVRDAAGNVVKNFDQGSQKLGPQALKWDGTTDAGARAPSGMYSFEITAKAAGGRPVVATTKVSGLVTSVTYENGTPEVVVGTSHVPLGDVTTISQ